MNIGAEQKNNARCSNWAIHKKEENKNEMQCTERTRNDTELVREVEPEYEPRGMHGEALEELEEDELELW